jgi:uncharacterized protein involved in propanediol utilization
VKLLASPRLVLGELGGRRGRAQRPGASRVLGPVGWGSCNGSFGELLQGVLPRPEAEFLVTLPITRTSRAEFVNDPSLDAVEVVPGHKTKARAVAQRMLATYGLPPGGRLTLTSSLPEGKGLASSTADLVATVRAVAAVFWLVVEASSIEALLRDIEPSDGLMHPDVVCFRHREVRLRSRLGPIPPMTILAIDEGGIVDTVAFNRRQRDRSAETRAEYAVLLARLERAVAAGDLPEIGRVATRSAVLNQALLPKRHLDVVRSICGEIGGLGVVATHSGTCLGILLANADARQDARLASGRELLAGLDGRTAVYRTRAW